MFYSWGALTTLVSILSWQRSKREQTAYVGNWQCDDNVSHSVATTLATTLGVKSHGLGDLHPGHH